MARQNLKSETQKKIRKAAAEVLAEQGYQKATIARISKLVGLSEAAIYEYFQNKEELLLTIPAAWTRKGIDEIDEHLFGIKGAFNKLRKFLWWYLRFIEKEPNTSKVVFLHLKTNVNFMHTSEYVDVRTFYSILTDIFEEGRASGEMKKEMTPHVARAIFLGTIEHIVIRWLLKDMSYSLFDCLEETFSYFEDAFRARRSESHA